MRARFSSPASERTAADGRRGRASGRGDPVPGRWISKAWKSGRHFFPRLGKLSAAFFQTLENARRVAALLLALALAASVRAQRDDLAWPETEREELPAGDEVLRRVRESVPQAPLFVRAQLLARDRRGEVERTLNVGLRLDWRADPPRADFVVMDAFGAPLAQATLRRPAEGAPEWTIALGDPPVVQEPPRPEEPIAGTQFAWSDLGLDPLWWPNAKTTGTEMKKSRLCYVVEVAAPPGAGRVARARMLVDSGVYALLEAETFDAYGRRRRRLEVKSLKKVNDVWTLQDLEIRDFESGRRTTLRVLESRLEGAIPAEEAPSETEIVPAAPAP